MMVVEAAKPLLTVAIHPSGYYLAAGFKDKIRIYHILHDDLRIFRNIERKYCSKIKFSYGGQFLVCIVQKHIFIYKSYTLECIFSEKISSSNVTDIRFSKNDTCLLLVTADGFMQRWIYDNGFQKLNDGAVSHKNVDFRACQFVNGLEDELQIVLSGGENDRSNVKIISHKDEIIQSFYGQESKITSGDMINTPNKIANYIAGTDRGSVKVYNVPLLQDAFEEFFAHSGEVTQVIISPDSRFVFSTGIDGTLFVFSVHEYLNEHENFKPLEIEEEKVQVEDFTSMIVDKALAEIVLVKKADMEEWRKKQENLKQEMEEMSAKVESSIAEVTNKYKKEITNLEIDHKREIKIRDERINKLISDSETSQHEYNENIKSMELSHIEMIEELKAIFDKKSSIDNSNYLTLEQKMHEMEQDYKNQLKKQEEKNKNDQEEIRATYRGNIILKQYKIIIIINN